MQVPLPGPAAAVIGLVAVAAGGSMLVPRP
jgi:hypothetical protein